MLNCIPTNERTYTVCHRAIIKNPHDIQHVQCPHIRARLYKKCLSINPLSLQHMPLGEVSDELILLAVKKNGTCIQYLPVERMTEAVCMYACMSLCHIPYDWIPEKYIDTMQFIFCA